MDILLFSRAVIPTNPKLAEFLNAIEINKLVESEKPLPDENLLVQEFFFLLAVCNTVIVAKKPHRDTMNANGIITNETPGSDESTLPRPSRNSLSPQVISNKSPVQGIYIHLIFY